MSSALEKLKNAAKLLNEKGIPVPMIRINGKASASFTMVVVSFGLCVLGLIGKSAGFLGGVNLAEALSLLQISCVLFFGRTLTSGFLPNNTPPPAPIPPSNPTVNISVDNQP